MLKLAKFILLSAETMLRNFFYQQWPRLSLGHRERQSVFRDRCQRLRLNRLQRSVWVVGRRRRWWWWSRRHIQYFHIVYRIAPVVEGCILNAIVIVGEFDRREQLIDDVSHGTISKRTKNDIVLESKKQKSFNESGTQNRNRSNNKTLQIAQVRCDGWLFTNDDLKVMTHRN